MPAPRIHHLNCGTMCPRGRRLLAGEGGWREDARLVCHVLLVEGADGLTLVDTGFGVGDVRTAAQMDRVFKAMTRPVLREEETALAQVQRLGFDPADVRHLVMTHLDIDHAGGLPDFPRAEVHLWERELEVMRNPPWRERRRYAMADTHWAHGPRWVTHAPGGDDWFGFASVRVLGDEVLLIPLPGHSFGHAAVAVRREAGWWLHCGDAFFHAGDLRTPSACPPGLRAFQNLVGADRATRLANQERLRELQRAHGSEVTLLCSHDPGQFEQAA